MKLKYMIDTNICIYIINERPKSVLKKFEEINVGEMGMSIITFGEMLYEAEKSKFKKKTKANLEQLASYISPLPLPALAAKHYGEIRSKLEKEGKIIGANDLWIASHALSLKLTLVTNNTKEFKRISGLSVENWT